MKKSIILFLFFVPLFVLAQNNESEKSRKFSIGINFSPDYSYRTLKPDEKELSQAVVDIWNDLEFPKLGYTTGINFNYYLSKRISFETGILFSDKGERTDWRYLIIGPRPGQPQQPNKPVAIKYNHHYYYLDFPLRANIYLLTGKTKLYLSGGMSANVFLSHVVTSKARLEDGTIRKRTSNSNVFKYSSLNIALISGFGISHDIKERFVIRFEPTLRNSLTPLYDYKDANVERYLYSVGLNFGLSYKL